MPPPVPSSAENMDEAVLKLCVRLAKTLGLHEWAIGIANKPADEEAFAEVVVTPYRRVATIKLCEDFGSIGHRDILHVLIHELLHLYFADTKQLIEDLYDTHAMNGDAHAVLQLATHRSEEVAVDQMAKAWAELMWEWDSVHKALRKITKQVERTTP